MSSTCSFSSNPFLPPWGDFLPHHPQHPCGQVRFKWSLLYSYLIQIFTPLEAILPFIRIFGFYWLTPPQTSDEPFYRCESQWRKGENRPVKINAAFRLACPSPHCHFDDDIYTTAQAPLAAEGRPSSKQHHANQSITSPLVQSSRLQTVDFNLEAMPLDEKAKAQKVAWSLRAVTLKRQVIIMGRIGNAASAS